MKWRVTEAVFLKPDGCASQRRCEPGEVIAFSGPAGLGLQPLDAEARAVKRRSIRPDWARSLGSIRRLALSLGATSNTPLSECRTIVENFLSENPIAKETA